MKGKWKYILIFTLAWALFVHLIPVTDASSAPLLAELSIIKIPGYRAPFTLFDMAAMILIISLYLRLRKKA